MAPVPAKMEADLLLGHAGVPAREEARMVVIGGGGGQVAWGARGVVSRDRSRGERMSRDQSRGSERARREWSSPGSCLPSRCAASHWPGW
eukprot:3357609-Rhodomonas_salina.1